MWFLDLLVLKFRHFVSLLNFKLVTKNLKLFMIDVFKKYKTLFYINIWRELDL